MKSTVNTFISEQRVLLDRLERFAQEPGYSQLLQVIKEQIADDAEPWLCEWLISSAYGLGARPIDVVTEPAGIEQLVAHLRRVLSGTGA